MLKSTFPGFVLKVTFALRGCQEDRVLINHPSRLTGQDITFHTCVCVLEYVLIQFRYFLCKRRVAEIGICYEHTSFQQISLQSLLMRE